MALLLLLIVCTFFTTSLAEVVCPSWRLGVETNNVRNWRTVPAECEDDIGKYMQGNKYLKDSRVVAEEAAIYAQSIQLKGDGLDIWVFDIDETTLSNLPQYAKQGFGAGPSNFSTYDEWIDSGLAPALPESLKLYEKLRSMGYKIAFLTNRPESKRNVTSENLQNVGYLNWDKLLMRVSLEIGSNRTSGMVFKSGERKKLEEEGYRIIGNMGDQWSDLLGTNIGDRTFKVPNPMYYST